MAKGALPKQDFIIANQKPAPGKAAPGDDTLSAPDKGKDFVKNGETA